VSLFDQDGWRKAGQNLNLNLNLIPPQEIKEKRNSKRGKINGKFMQFFCASYMDKKWGTMDCLKHETWQ
jgi:hypothetical protein